MSSEAYAGQGLDKNILNWYNTPTFNKAGKHMNIVIIAYRPDHTDYCRGNRMSSSESDMQGFTADSYQEGAEFLAEYMAANKIRDMYEYAEYEFTYIINGIDERDWEQGEEVDTHRRMHMLALKKADVIVDQHKKDVVEKEAEEARLHKEETTKLELETLRKLQEKHGTHGTPPYNWYNSYE